MTHRKDHFHGEASAEHRHLQGAPFEHGHQQAAETTYARPHEHWDPEGEDLRGEHDRADQHDVLHADNRSLQHDHPHEHAASTGLFGKLFHGHSHDASDSLDDALAGSAEGIRTVKISLVGLGITALIQLAVVLMSGSVALLADTIHNVADASTAIPLWLAFSLSRRRPSDRYTYGYGRAEDIAGIFVVLMIASSAAVAAWESVQRLIHPQPVSNLVWVGVAALIGFLGNEAVAQYRIRTGERIGSAALVADGYHARTDGLTSLAVLFGALGVWLGFPKADPLVGLGITVAILLVLKDAVRQIWHRLMDAVDPAILAQATKAAESAAGVESVSQVRARWIGHTIHAEVLLTAKSSLLLGQAHAVAERARHAMLHAVPKLSSVTVHVDPDSADGHDYHAKLQHHDRARVTT
jgi:cation diffusion facilitator family transporter